MADKNIQPNNNSKEWYSGYEIPVVAYGITDIILTADEQLLIAAFGKDSFSAFDVRTALGLSDENVSREFLDNAYRRGVISVIENGYKINNFFSRLDIVAVNERDVYLSIPEETRDKLEALYFDRYYEALDWSKNGGLPTDDAVITYDETIDLIERKVGEGKNIYLANCDCRSLKNSCDHKRDVCLSFDEGVNTWGDRGVSDKITLEEAKEVIARADKDGLIHTSNPHGICNCCTDCCYLFRSKARHADERVTSEMSPCHSWPAVTKTITVNDESCIGCGRCVKRCPVGALSIIRLSIMRKKVRKVEGLCIGCGLCVSVCKTDALTLHPLNKKNER
jgi:ferredoxin